MANAIARSPQRGRHVEGIPKEQDGEDSLNAGPPRQHVDIHF